jgi:hypothetical protein
MAGDIHFDEDETWTNAIRDNDAQPIDLETVAAHEIGHSLGLDHTSVAGSLMLATYTSSHRFLGSDDIAGVRSIYGIPGSNNGNNLINGPNLICPNNSATYSVPNPPTGLAFTWSSSNTALATINPSTGIATRVGNGTVTFTATANSGCGSVTLSKRVTVGTPLTPAFTYSNALSMCYGQAPVGDFATSNVQPGVSYAWDIVDQATAEIVLSGSGSIFYFNSATLYPGSFRVTMRASACGATASRGLTMTINDCGGGGMFRTATVYPNPATDMVTVELPAGARPPAWAGVFDVVLFDHFGQQLRTGRGQADKAELDVRTLPNGLYYLRIGAGNDAAYKQVQVAH